MAPLRYTIQGKEGIKFCHLATLQVRGPPAKGWYAGAEAHRGAEGPAGLRPGRRPRIAGLLHLRLRGVQGDNAMVGLITFWTFHCLGVDSVGKETFEKRFEIFHIGKMQKWRLFKQFLTN